MSYFLLKNTKNWYPKFCSGYTKTGFGRILNKKGNGLLSIGAQSPVSVDVLGLVNLSHCAVADPGRID